MAKTDKEYINPSARKEDRKPLYQGPVATQANKSDYAANTSAEIFNRMKSLYDVEIGKLMPSDKLDYSRSFTKRKGQNI
jgi:hypothetical protein